MNIHIFNQVSGSEKKSLVVYCVYMEVVHVVVSESGPRSTDNKTNANQQIKEGNFAFSCIL
jgi:hypothetical protein